MIRGLYTSASGMTAAQTRSEVVADNISNIKTTGYKEESSSARAFPSFLIQRRVLNAAQNPESVPIGALGTGVIIDRVTKINENGSLKNTGENTDLALASDGFFVVQTPNGERYTRNGQFRVGTDGILETAEGYPVLGENGPIQLSGSDFSVSPEGTVTDRANPMATPRLRIVTIADQGSLRREGQSLYAADQMAQEAEPVSVNIQQGFLEESNVDLAGQMVQMIKIMRAYEANQRLIQTTDLTLDKAVNEVGKV